ncbi:MAG: tRNA (adenosine(37)-N6)-threonylcarbamoyltransferase complex dimerization subunit type 1 TsaB [Deltaproteobacteria bacterium]|nr:tRNA (adenosine(37)-N6)-threonylcarbamoyltransferase complex dimerization subunit type 1 TsaB [Deltaproteobacteria bacterium]
MMTGVIGMVECRDEPVLLAERILVDPTSHEEKLFQKLEDILSLLSMKPSDINGIIVGIGPGSFTGLRVGLAAAKGMALSLGIPIVGVSSLDVLEQSLGGGMVVPLIDARRGEIYGQVRGQVQPAALSPESWCDRLQALLGPFVCVGDGAERYASILSDRLSTKISFGPRIANLSRGLAMLKLGVQKTQHGGDDLAALIPQYLRVSDAEIGFRRRVDSVNLS